MAKVFNSFEKIAIKNAAKAIAALQTKQKNLKENIKKLEEQIASHEEDIKVFEDSVSSITGGFKPQTLVEKVAREGGKQSDWVFKYPTIIPDVVETTENQEEQIAVTEPPTPMVITNDIVEEPFIDSNTATIFADAPIDPMDDVFND